MNELFQSSVSRRGAMGMSSIDCLGIECLNLDFTRFRDLGFLSPGRRQGNQPTQREKHRSVTTACAD